MKPGCDFICSNCCWLKLVVFIMPFSSAYYLRVSDECRSTVELPAAQACFRSRERLGSQYLALETWRRSYPFQSSVRPTFLGNAHWKRAERFLRLSAPDPPHDLRARRPVVVTRHPGNRRGIVASQVVPYGSQL